MVNTPDGPHVIACLKLTSRVGALGTSKEPFAGEREEVSMSNGSGAASVVKDHSPAERPGNKTPVATDLMAFAGKTISYSFSYSKVCLKESVTTLFEIFDE